MAILGHSDRRVMLPARCLVGRSRACDLVIDDLHVSSQHAAIEWDGAQWLVRDLGSSNGTFLGRRKLTAGEPVALVKGSELGFGRQSTTWVLEDCAAPALMAVKLSTDESVVGINGYLVLPDSQQPELGIGLDARGQWRVECRGESAAVEDRTVVTTPDGAAWRVYLPTRVVSTSKDLVQSALLKQLELRFAYSRDEETVELTVRTPATSHTLKPRAHHYPLLLLARQRLADRQAGVEASEQGWIPLERLLKMLQIDDNHLNISIHRARAQFSQIGVVDATGLVERRPGTRQVRLGVERIELVQLDPLPQ